MEMPDNRARVAFMGAPIPTGCDALNAVNSHRVGRKSEFEAKRRTTRIWCVPMLNKLKQIRMQDCESARGLQVRMP